MTQVGIALCRFHVRVAQNFLHFIDGPSLIYQKTGIAMAQIMYAHISDTSSFTHSIPGVIYVHIGRSGNGIKEDMIDTRNPFNATQ